MRIADAFAAGEEADAPYLTGTTNAEFPDSVFVSLARPPTLLGPWSSAATAPPSSRCTAGSWGSSSTCSAT